jgi:hypothetical protein
MNLSCAAYRGWNDSNVRQYILSKFNSYSYHWYLLYTNPRQRRHI